MATYVLLWIFPDYLANFLVFSFLLKALTIPYFLRIGEKPVVYEAAFLMLGEVIGIVLNSGAAASAAKQCALQFGL